MSDFPTMVYKIPGRHNAGHGKTFDYRGVNDQETFDKLLAEGWTTTHPDKIGEKTTIEVEVVEKPKRGRRKTIKE